MVSQNEITIDGITYESTPGYCHRGGGCGPFDKCALEEMDECTNPRIMVCCSAQDRIDKREVVWRKK